MNKMEETEHISNLYLILIIVSIIVILVGTFIGAFLFVQDYKAKNYGSAENQFGKELEVSLLKKKQKQELSNPQKLENDRKRISIDKAIKIIAF